MTFPSPKSKGAVCPCLCCQHRLCLLVPHSPTCFAWSTTPWATDLFSYQCIQFSLENIKRWQIHHCCKYLVSLSALAGRNVILIVDWISLNLCSRKLGVYCYFFSNRLKKLFASLIFYLRRYIHAAIRPLLSPQLSPDNWNGLDKFYQHWFSTFIFHHYFS